MLQCHYHKYRKEKTTLDKSPVLDIAGYCRISVNIKFAPLIINEAKTYVTEKSRNPYLYLY